MTGREPDPTLAERARQLVAQWPPLTPDQIHHVAEVLRNGAKAGGA